VEGVIPGQAVSPVSSLLRRSSVISDLQMRDHATFTRGERALPTYEGTWEKENESV